MAHGPRIGCQLGWEIALRRTRRTEGHNLLSKKTRRLIIACPQAFEGHAPASNNIRLVWNSQDWMKGKIYYIYYLILKPSRKEAFVLHFKISQGLLGLDLVATFYCLQVKGASEAEIGTASLIFRGKFPEVNHKLLQEWMKYWQLSAPHILKSVRNLTLALQK